MGNEMGNNNTSEFREEEKEKAEGPEKSLLEGGGKEVETDEVADFPQKEAKSGCDDADRVNGDHHVTEKEEEKKKAYNSAEFQVVSENLPDITEEDNEVQEKSKEDKEMEFNLEVNRSDGNEHEHKKQASNEKEEEGESGSNWNTTILALDEAKLEKTSDIKSNQHELLDIKAESLVEDSSKSPEECKDALELSLNNTCHSADCVMEDSEETTNMDQVIGTGRGTDKENDEERGKGSNFNVITQASEDPKSEKSSDFDAGQVIDTDRNTDKEDDGEREKSSNFDTITQASEDPKSEKTLDFDVDLVIDIDRDTNKEDDGKREKSSNFDTITQALEDPYFDVDQVIDTDRDADKEDDGDRGKSSNFDTITQALEDPYFDVDQVIDTDRDADKEDDEDRGKSSNFDTITQALEDPYFDVDQVIDIDRDADKEDDGDRGKSSNFDTITQALEDPKSEKTSDFDVDQVIDIGRDTDKEHDADRGKCSHFETLHVSKDPKSEKTSDHKSIQHEFPETKAKSLVGSSDGGSSQESMYGLGFSSIRTEDNGHIMHTEKPTNVDCIRAEADTNVEKKKGDLIEPRPCHEYTMPAKNVDTKDEETATELICPNSSCSPPEESLVLESPKSAMQVPEVEDICTREESQLREEHLGTETVVQDNIPTQSKISNGVQEEVNTIGSHSGNNAEETEVLTDLVDKNQNEAPGEDSEDSDGEYLEISDQGMTILTLSIGECKHKNEDMGETMEIPTNNGHEAERWEPEESIFEPVLGFQPQIHQKETSITFQNVDSTDKSISTIEESKKNPPDSPRYIQTASATSTETKPSTNPINERNVTKLPISTFGEEDQESPGRTSNESNSDNSIGHIEMRKSPSFNIDIQSEGRAEETEKIPLLYQIKTIEDLPNPKEISFSNPMEKRVVKLGRSYSEKSRASFPGFAKEKEESEMEFKDMDEKKLAASKKGAIDLPPPSPIRKGKRRTKSLIFGSCICCATAIN